MRARLLTVAAALAASSPLMVHVDGQAGARPAASRALPRMPDGHPDLQGTYDLATMTPMERAAGTPLVLTDEQAAKLEETEARRSAAADAPIRGDRPAPPVGGDGSVGAAGNVGGYNNFWLDRGSHFTVVDGQKRASLLVDPPDGRVPALTPDARQRNARRQFRPQSDQAIRENDPGLEPPGSYDDPERRPLGERCLLGFGSTSGPPILPNYFYNNLHQIVQTRDTVMILTEMVHDARIVRIGGQHAPPTIRKWLGDSIGHWEGDTLVVDTTNFTDKTRFRGSSENLHVVERFTRVDANTIRYQFTIEDPTTWTRPWTGEYAWPATKELVYEYACHEGNYALENILRGARLKETEEKRNSTDEVKVMRTRISTWVAGLGLVVAAAVPAFAHHAFGGEFDPNKPVLLKGTVTKVEWVNPHAWIHLEVTKPDGTKEEWMVEGGTPNTLLRRGITRDSLKVGTQLVVDGYQARDHSLLRANGRNVTFPDGRKLFLGSSGTGAPTDGADPTEPAKPGQRGRGGR